MAILSKSKRATTPTTDHHLSNLPFTPLLKIMRFLDAPALEKIRCGSRSLNEFVVLNRNLLVWRRLRTIRMSRAIDREQKIIYSVEVQPGTVKCFYPKYQDFFKTEYTKGSPSISFALMWLATKLPNCCIERLELRAFCFDDEDYHEVAETIVERNLRIHKLILQNPYSRADSTSFIRFLNTINSLDVSILQEDSWGHLQTLPFDDTFFTYMAKLVSLEIRGHSKPIKLIPVLVPFDKIPKKFISFGVFLMPLSTVLNAISDWYDGCEEFRMWIISISIDECPNLEHLAKAIEFKCPCGVTPNGEELSIIRNRGGKKIRVRLTVHSNLVPDNAMFLLIERY